MAAQHEYLTVNGKRIECAWFGPGPDDAPTLVFMHEGLGCVDMWKGFPERAAQATGCGALVFSRLGYGRSDPCELPRPVSFMHHEGLEELPAFIRAAGLKRYVLIGHSDGGSIGIIYAGGTEAPGLCGLVTLAAHVFCEEITTKSIEQARKAFLQGGLRRALARYHGPNTDCAFWGWNGAWLHPDFPNWNIEQYLPGVRVPMLAIQGESDKYGTSAQMEAIKKRAPGVELHMLPDCGHSPHQDQPRAVLGLISGFAARVLPQRQGRGAVRAS